MANWHKSIQGFTRLGNSLEAPPAALAATFTPAEQFFVCTSGDPVTISPDTYRLKIKGDAAERVTTLSLADLQALPQHSVDAYIECAGNGRTLFETLDGQSITRDSTGEDVKWTLGGISMGKWSGPRLADVLALAGLKDTARWVAPMGLDVLNPECDIEIPMPIEKALHEDTLVGLTLNDAPLPVDHGYPARMIVPGWIGTYWVKWVGWLTVSAQEIRNYRTDEYYVIDGKTVTEQNIKSSLALPFPATLPAGPQSLTGVARSPGQSISAVDFAVDDAPWQPAEILSTSGKWGWTRFGLDVDLTAGAHTIRTRATDSAGRTQPERGYMNASSMLYNGIIAHPVTAA